MSPSTSPDDRRSSPPANDEYRAPVWWLWTRRIVSFGLGVWVIVDSLTEQAPSIGKLIIGLVMIGVLPLDDLFKTLTRAKDRR
jgi:hypothetical protein